LKGDTNILVEHAAPIFVSHQKEDWTEVIQTYKEHGQSDQLKTECSPSQY